MLDWGEKLLGGGVGRIIDSVKGVVDEFHLSGEEKQEFKMKMEAALQESIRSEMQAKERILVAELTQGDKYTKRARPTMVYFGLVVIAFNYCVVPLLQMFKGMTVDPFILPDGFWMGWSGVVATWSIGRTTERIGFRNRVTKAITGAPDVGWPSASEAKG